MAPPRTISRERFDQLAGGGKEIITESSEPSGLSPDVALEAGVEQQQPATSPEAVAPPATPIISVEAPVVNVEAPAITVEAPVVTLRPEIIVQAPDVIVNAPDMKPIADALAEMHDGIMESIGAIQIPQPQVTVEPQQAPDMTPIAEAMLKVAEAVQAKPDHSEAILEMVRKIADRPTTATWSFDITRDNNGNIASVQAVKSNNE